MRQKILVAIANLGNTSMGEVARVLKVPRSTVNSYFFPCPRGPICLVNGDLVQWERGKRGTLRLGPNAAVVRNKAGRAIMVGRCESMS